MNAHNEQSSVVEKVAAEMREFYDAEMAPDDDVLKSWIDRLAAQPSPVVKQNLTTQPAAAQLGDRLDRAYAERNALAIAFAKAALAAGWRAGRGYDDDQSKDWAPQWRHVVYVDLPDGRQVSWHMAPTEVELLDRLPQYAGEWNGEFTARDPSWCRFDAPAAAQEAVAYRLEVQTVGSEPFTQYVTDRAFIATLRNAGCKVSVTPLYAAPVTAAPAVAYMIDGRTEQGLTFDKAAAETMAFANGGTVRALGFVGGTPAAPGIDLATAWAEGYRSGVTDERISESNIGIAGFGAKIEPARANPYLIDASPKGATFPNDGNSEAQFIADGERLNCPACGGSGHVEDSPKGGSDALDATRLDWLDANGFTAYRQIDPIDGLSPHCVVVHETQLPRRGNVHDTIRGAIDAAMQAQANSHGAGVVG